MNKELLCPRKTNTLSNIRGNGGVPFYSHAHAFPNNFVKRSVQDVVATPMGSKNQELYDFMESMFNLKNLEEKIPYLRTFMVMYNN